MFIAQFSACLWHLIS